MSICEKGTVLVLFYFFFPNKPAVISPAPLFIFLHAPPMLVFFPFPSAQFLLPGLAKDHLLLQRCPIHIGFGKMLPFFQSLVIPVGTKKHDESRISAIEMQQKQQSARTMVDELRKDRLQKEFFDAKMRKSKMIAR